MKTIAFLCALPLLFWGCDTKNKVKYVYLRSYITWLLRERSRNVDAYPYREGIG